MFVCMLVCVCCICNEFLFPESCCCLLSINLPTSFQLLFWRLFLSILLDVHVSALVCCGSVFALTNQIKSLTLFVTHYPLLARLEVLCPGVVANYHMSFLSVCADFYLDKHSFNHSIHQSFFHAVNLCVFAGVIRGSKPLPFFLSPSIQHRYSSSFMLFFTDERRRRPTRFAHSVSVSACARRSGT